MVHAVVWGIDGFGAGLFWLVVGLPLAIAAIAGREPTVGALAICLLVISTDLFWAGFNVHAVEITVASLHKTTSDGTTEYDVEGTDHSHFEVTALVYKSLEKGVRVRCHRTEPFLMDATTHSCTRLRASTSRRSGR